MNKLFFVFAVAGALAACDQSDTATVSGPGDPSAAENNTAAIVLPPAIVASKTYRCSGDNSVVYIDWYGDGSARVKSSQTDLGTKFPAPVEGAEAQLLEGSAEASSITYDGRTCNA